VETTRERLSLSRVTFTARVRLKITGHQLIPQDYRRTLQNQLHKNRAKLSGRKSSAINCTNRLTGNNERLYGRTKHVDLYVTEHIWGQYKQTQSKYYSQ